MRHFDKGEWSLSMKKILKALLKPCISGPVLILPDSSGFGNGKVEFVEVAVDFFTSLKLVWIVHH